MNNDRSELIIKPDDQVNDYRNYIRQLTNTANEQRRDNPALSA